MNGPFMGTSVHNGSGKKVRTPFDHAQGRLFGDREGLSSLSWVVRSERVDQMRQPAKQNRESKRQRLDHNSDSLYIAVHCGKSLVGDCQDLYGGSQRLFPVAAWRSMVCPTAS